MIKETDNNQQKLPGFDNRFDIPLDEQNRWVKLSKQLPWEALSAAYNKAMSKKQGRPSKPARLVIGAVYIKHKLKLSDQETIYTIQENPYLQYFVGLTSFTTKPIFVPSLFVEIRKRMGKEVFEQFNQSIIDSIKEPKSELKKEDDDSDSDKGQPAKEDESKVTHAGKLLLDATVSEQAIRFPTDLSLLNEAREISERTIDKLYKHSCLEKKPRTYRQKARKAFLALAKQKKPSGKKRRGAVKKQLQFLKRNLKTISSLVDQTSLEILSAQELKHYWIIQELYRQQQSMYDEKTNRCDHRIVSIHQPQVRPIVRGKWNKKTEFGAKYGVSLTLDGIACIDHLSWEAYNEGTDLPEQVEQYKERHGYYPEAVLADTIYGTRSNRQYLQNLGIRFSGKALGRPSAKTNTKEAIKKRKAEYLQRIPIEGKFGQGKNGYNLNYIRARTSRTSEAWIYSIFFVMNVAALAKIRLFALGNRTRHYAKSTILCLQKVILSYMAILSRLIKQDRSYFLVFE